VIAGKSGNQKNSLFTQREENSQSNWKSAFSGFLEAERRHIASTYANAVFSSYVKLAF